MAETEIPLENKAEAPVEETTKTFRLPVDSNNKATKINILSVARPHLRAFHFAWFSFFLAFFGWFALAPMQGNIKKNNDWLSKGNRFKYQNIIAVAGTIIMRLIVGPFCDQFGPRLAQASLLGIFSIPLFLVGTARNFASWTIARFFIGFIGASFVVTQFWTSVSIPSQTRAISHFLTPSRRSCSRATLSVLPTPPPPVGVTSVAV